MEDLRIGSVDDPDYALTWIWALVVGPEGRMFALHPNEQIVRIFSPTGDLERVTGGQGEGPGEFVRPTHIGVADDTVWVYDGGAVRFTRFGWDGELIDVMRAPAPAFDLDAGERRIFVERLLDGGRAFGRESAPTDAIVSGEITHGKYFVMARDGSGLDLVARIPFGESTWEIGDVGKREAPRMYTRQPYADGPLHVVADRHDGLWILDRTTGRGETGSDYVLLRVTFAGDTTVHRHVTASRAPITDAEVEEILDPMFDMIRDGPIGQGVSAVELRRRVERDFYRPSDRPGASALIAGRDGTVWVGETPRIAPQQRWLVFDHVGEPVQRVVLPDSVRVLAAERGTVWGAKTGDLGVPYLVRFRVPAP